MMKKIELFLKSFTFSLLRLLIKKNKRQNLLNLNSIKRILILRYDVIGDMLVTIPMIDYLTQEIDNVKIDILASPTNYKISKGISNLNKVFIFQSIFFKFINLIRELRQRNYDLIYSVVFNRNTFGAFISNLIAGKNTAIVTNLNKDRAHIYSKLFDIMIDLENEEKNRTMAEQLLLITQKSLYLKGTFPESISISLQNDNDDFAEKIISSIEKRSILGYNLSAGAPNRMFSNEMNIKIINLLIKNFPDFQILILASPKDFESAILISEKCPNSLLCPVSNNILDIGAVIKRLSYVITPDTAIVHLAAAFQIPSLVFFNINYTKFTDWLPYKTKYRHILTSDNDSLDKIPTEEIIEEFRNLISQ